MELHNKEKPFKCSVFEKSFTRSDRLHDHLKVHCSKDFKCSQCPKKFAQLDLLLIHERVHTGEKTFTCLIFDLVLLNPDEVEELKKKVDNKRIATAADLVQFQSDLDMLMGRDVRRGTGQNHFFCLICGANTKTRQKIRNHVEAHHVTGTEHICPDCHKSAKTRASLEQHKAKNH